MNNSKILKCPVCGDTLFQEIKTLVCPNKHSFDIAKEGYANLMKANQKKSKNPGDDAVMIKTRHDFLNKGFFDELIQEISKIILEEKIENSVILDAGCGPGYYLKNLPQQVLQNNQVFGVDISKDGIKVASKNTKTAKFFVASVFDLPFKDHSIDLLLNIFAPKPTQEFKRVLSSHGKILEVTPAENHMLEIKQELYQDSTHKNPKEKDLPFSLELFKRVTFTKTLSNSNDILELTKMTPYFHTTKKEALDRLFSLSNLTVTFDFNVKLWSV